jgi:mono/diheme cytochrome c family protein
MSGRSDAYLFDLVKHGGAPIGRPGMPGFGATLSDADIALLVAYARSLPARAAKTVGGGVPSPARSRAGSP